MLYDLFARNDSCTNNWRFVIYTPDILLSDGEIINSKIKIQLNHSAAPMHSENFALLTLSGCYDNSIFHRIIEGFMIQGGDFQNNVGTGGYAAKWYGYCNGKTVSQDGVSYTAKIVLSNFGHYPVNMKMG